MTISHYTLSVTTSLVAATRYQWNTEGMESLAIVITLLLLIQVLLGAVALTFAILFRRRGTFKLTSMILIGLLALQTIWALSVQPAFGYPSLVFLVAAGLVRFLKTK
jgi:heme A synthase